MDYKSKCEEKRKSPVTPKTNKSEIKHNYSEADLIAELTGTQVKGLAKLEKEMVTNQFLPESLNEYLLRKSQKNYYPDIKRSHHFIHQPDVLQL